MTERRLAQGRRYVTLSAGWIIALFPALLLKKPDHLEIGGHCAAPSSIGGRR